MYARIAATLIPFIGTVVIVYTILVLAAFYLVEDYVLGSYLKNELVSFEKNYKSDGKEAALPSTSFVKAYWKDDPHLPHYFSDYSAGLHEITHKGDNDNHAKDFLGFLK